MRMKGNRGSILYLECAGGVAGDMLAGALLDLGDESDERAVRAALESLPGRRVRDRDLACIPCGHRVLRFRRGAGR